MHEKLNSREKFQRFFQMKIKDFNEQEKISFFKLVPYKRAEYDRPAAAQAPVDSANASFRLSRRNFLQKNMAGRIFRARHGCQLAMDDDQRIYLHGGVGNQVYNAVETFDAHSGRIIAQEARMHQINLQIGTQVSNGSTDEDATRSELKRLMSRVDHSLVYIKHQGRKKLVIYGGQDHKEKLANDPRLADVRRLLGDVISTTQTEGRRGSHTVSVTQSKAGNVGSGSADSFKINEEVSQGGTFKAQFRNCHKAICVFDPELQTTEVLADPKPFKDSNGHFIVPEGRRNHLAFALGNNMIIIGGLNDYQLPLNDIVALEYGKRQWNVLYPSKPLEKKTHRPDKRTSIQRPVQVAKLGAMLSGKTGLHRI
jgi:hypothetical protein